MAMLDRRNILTAAIGTPLTVFGGRISAQVGSPLPPTVPARLGMALRDPVASGFGVYDPAPLGYIAEERLMFGRGATYRPIHEGDFTVPSAAPGSPPDPQGGPLGGVGAGPPPEMPGMPRFDPLDMSPRRATGMGDYVTRLIIYRPRDPRRFSGRVLVETIHPQGGGSTSMWAVLNRSIASRGDAWVGVSHPRSLPWLRFHWPERYGALDCGDYSLIWSMLADTARLLRRAQGSPLGRPARLIFLTGYSFTGLIATSFAKQHHATEHVPGRPPVFDGYPIGTGAGPMPPLDVPVMIGANQSARYNDTDVQPPSTSPAMMSRPIRIGFDADGPMSRRRRYEVPGFEHAPMPAAESGTAIPPSLIPQSGACYGQWPAGATANPNHVAFQLYEAMLRNMIDWIERGIAPPRAPLIESIGGVPLIGDDGNVRGGLRFPDVLVPTASYATGSGACALRGWRVPYTPERLLQLYGSWDKYRRKYDEATEQLVVKRFLTSERATLMERTLARSMPTF